MTQNPSFPDLPEEEITLSIVTTLYYSSPFIDDFYTRITQEALKITSAYEIIFVDDGSPDDSLSKVLTLHRMDERIVVVELSKNFGHHKAIMEGLAHARGEFIFLLDSDLEEEPELLSRFWIEFHKETDIDVIFGVQESRKGGWFERWSGGLFWKIFNWVSVIKVPENMSTARLFNAAYHRYLMKFSERELFLGGICHAFGFKQLPCVIQKKHKKSSSYSFHKKVSLLVNSVTSFSSSPLKGIFYLGVFISITSFLYSVYIIFNKLVFGMVLEGWTSLVVSVWMLGGVILLSIGTLGIYLSKIFDEVKNRPRVAVKKLYRRNA